VSSITQTVSREHTAPGNGSPEPADYSNPAEVQRRARAALFAGARHIKMEAHGPRFHQHYADMLQEAALALYENQHEPAAVAWTRAKFAVTLYIALHVYRWNRTGWTIEDSKRYAPYDNFEDFDAARDSFDSRTVWDCISAHGRRLRYNVPRPVEEALLRREEQLEQLRRVDKVARRFLEAMLGYYKAWPLDEMHRGAYLLACYAVLGEGEVAAHPLVRGMTPEQVCEIVWGYRRRIAGFLALPPLLQGLVLARGRLSLYHHDELTPAIMNRNVPWVVILPHGAFRIYIKNPNGERGRRPAAIFEVGVKVGRRLRVRNVRIAPLGEVTYERLYRASLEMRDKVAGFRRSLAGGSYAVS
jgi:hypothetical protein